MNNVRLGAYRDGLIVSLVESRRCLDTEQIACLLFRGMKYGMKKCRERLGKISKANRLRRWQPDRCSPYIYYATEKRPAQIEHMKDTNWAYVWLCQRMTSSDRWLTWEAPDYGYLRPDALGVMYCKLPNEHRAWFIEMDRSDNRWDKTAKYLRLHNEREGYWWHRHIDFPSLLVVTTSAERANRITESLATEGMGLRFSVRLLSEIRGECLRWSRV